MESRGRIDRRAAQGLAVPALAAAGAAIASLGANALSIAPPDARYVAVSMGAAVPLLAGYLTRRAAKHRALFIALALPWLLAVAWPHSALSVAWLSGSVLSLGAEASFYAARVTSRPATSKWARIALASAVAAPCLGLLAGAAVVIVNMQLVIVPARLGHLNPEVQEGEVEVTFDSADGLELRGTFAPGTEGATGVLLVHGVSDGRDRWVPWARRLRADGLHSLRFDLRAHGQSEGAVCTYGQYERLDVAAAARWLRDQPGVGDVAVVGTSMGAGAALAASRDLEVEAMVLLAPASNYAPLVASRVQLLGPLTKPVLAVSAHLARAMEQTPMTNWSPRQLMSGDVPILVLHGLDDRAIPIALSRSLARDYANVRLIELREVGHDDVPGRVAGDEATWVTARDFLVQAGAIAP